MKHNTRHQKRRGHITDDSTIEQIAAALGLKASDWRTDLPEISFDDQETAAASPSDDSEESKSLAPAEIIDELKRLGQVVPAAHARTQLCIEELQAAVRLVSCHDETDDRGSWRVRGLPAHIPTPAENAERVAMLLGQAFTIVTSLASVCEGEKGYDAAALGRVEASLEQLSDSPETFQEAVLSQPARTRTTGDRTINQ